jgi:uncharacterized RDD family membrane protein YckC
VYCSKCGAAMADGAAFCSSCGQSFSRAAKGPAPVMNAVLSNAPAYRGVPVAAAGPRVEYAGFWLRVLAYIVDNVVIGVGLLCVLIPVFFLTGFGAIISHIHPQEDWGDAGVLVIVGFFFLAAVASLVVTWLYHALMESSEWQATVGKRMLGLVVTDMAGQRVSFARSTGRHFGKIITNLVPAFIGYIMAAFTERKQALHDMIAGCLILKRG